MSPSLRKAITVLSFFVTAFVQTSTAQKKGPDPQYKLIAGKGYVQSKNYYLLTLFEELPEVKKLLENDAVLQKLATRRSDSLDYALKNCQRDGTCFISVLKFTEEEIKSVSNRLAELCETGSALDKLVGSHLIPSGTYVLFQNLSHKEMLVKAWEQDAMGVNFCIGVYGEGKKANYPLIDSISFNTHDPRNGNGFPFSYVGLVYNIVSLLAVEYAGNKLFFETPMNAALHFVEMNERDQAADFEPMADGENREAVNKIKTTNWAKYKYSVILVPGAGPEEPKVALSAEGMLRCRLAAIQYQKGLAPFIAVSGGKVHPYKTIYCEATEMKKFLVTKLHVPASAVIIEPHARHTTTNMRNTARLMYRYGIPFSKPGITCTTRGQSMMIGTTLIARCLKELNEAPYKNGERLTETEIEFFPLIEALHINPTEVMDPQ